MKDQARTLPASWYRSKAIYELERRAIFLKAWYLLGPVTRFQDEQPVAHEIAGVRFTVEKKPGADGSHEFEVLRLGDEPDVVALPHKLTSSGLLFAAISPDQAPSFEEYFPGLEDLLARVDFTKLPLKRSMSYEGRFNWKAMVDGYQECLHCQYAHKPFSQLYPPTFYTVHNHGNYSRHFLAEPTAEDPQEKGEDGLFLYFFPNCTLNVYGGGMHCFRVCPCPPPTSAGAGADADAESTDTADPDPDPVDPGLTRMEFEYYHREPLGSPAFADYLRFVRRVALEDYELCEGAQRNLEAGVYARGVLNPDKERGVVHYQGLVREKVVGLFRREEEEEERMRRDKKPGEV